ncbi:MULTISPECIES: hypothetical protein [Leptospira]|uniref:Uncharacterized protein n=3 Tax=Leptospira kirschneri TaxID=29507 RepID=A0A1T1DGQ3_9LEPT|nr:MULTISPECIES: hypothetical protein [Leptospira]EJO69471.1 hypothetical protein LEP1GSC044_3215 [Leptospira kirschneri serovar Grippotyphosa str. RM52]EKO17416.1 hypothetical protein LEP1GSC081_0373 [Leptospira kirschneri str. H1]EKO61974.1 hypothetical protein LEP1GSC082_0433 [Leptospira kirschneri str. H2]EKP06041.1 hypothetical protein LEP1GSC018_2103 [Leptospira kirschneri str. 2008720114]EKQ83514.1 hypothetical protein LEP1GSC064_2523 [Leptospira kirschneri serovar Grippotyphosa str. Mo
MNISSGVQRISFPNESLTYVSPARMGGKVQAVEPIRREDFNSNARGTNFSTPPNESLPTTRGSLIDFYA